MKEIVYTNTQLKQKTASGIIFLFSRRFIYQLILTVSNIILARIFHPNIIGTFAIITFIILNIGIFTNLGLTQALIQRNKNSSEGELKSIFFILIITSLIFITVIYFLSPLLGYLYQDKMNFSDIYWLRIFSFYILFINLSNISQAMLEKKLAYYKLTIGDISTLFITQFFVIIFSFLNMGIGSFVLGNLLGSIIGMIIYFYIQPFKIGFNWNFSNLKPYLNFGINYQSGSLISALNSAIIPVVVGSMFGPSAVAFILMAGGIRQGVISVTEVFLKLAFNVSARSINNKIILKSLIEKITKFSCLISFPLIAIVVAVAPNLISVIYTNKWMPMLPALYLSLFAGVFLVLSNLFNQFLLALGRAKTVRNIIGFWTILQWLITFPLIKLWNYNGAVVAALIVSATFFIPLIKLKKEVNFQIMYVTLPFFISSIFTGIFTFVLTKLIIINSLFTLLAVSLYGLLFYLVLIFIIERDKLLIEIREFFKFALLKS